MRESIGSVFLYNIVFNKIIILLVILRYYELIKLEKSNFFDIFLLVWIIYMKKELTEDEKQITKKVIDGLTNDSSEELINLMKECNISDGVIMLTMLGIGTHTEYYKALYNRINNNKENMNDELVKKEVVDILHEIDRNEDE